VKNRPKCGPPRFFAKINPYTTVIVEKEAQNFGLLLQFSQKLPKVSNHHHPIGENSPNLVTLTREHEFGGFSPKY
jgi:hypothetical protein